MKIIKITKSGYLYIFTTIFLGFSGINTGNNLVYLITAALLGFMGISGLFGRKNIYGLNIALETPHEVFANREFPLKIILMNKRIFFPAFLIKVHLNEKEILFPFIKEKNSVTVSVPYNFGKRGINTIENIFISSVFPFNFFIRFNYLNISFEKIVFPEPKNIGNILTGDDNKKQLGQTSYNKKGFTGDLISIREYRDKDSIKFIHWKSSAKQDNLMVKEISDEVDNIATLDFDKINIPDIEKKLSFLTYIIVTLTKQGKKVHLKIDNKIIKNKFEMLKTLALK